MIHKQCTVYLFLLYAFFFNSSLFAQENNIEIFGYYEPQITGAYSKDKSIQMQSNKIRIDISSDIYENLVFAANYDYITYKGTTRYNILDYLPPDVVNTIPVESRDFFLYNFDDRNFLDNAYLKFSAGKFDFTAGKQQISAGSGYAWNPTDIFNIKDMFDPAYENPGVDGMRIEWQINARTNASVFYSPADEIKHSMKHVSMKTNIGHFDVSVSAGWLGWNYTDFITATPRTYRRQMTGIDVNGEFSSIGIRLEGAFNNMEDNKDYYEILGGLDYTFDSGLMIIIEYYYNETGKTDYADYDINDWMQYYTSEVKTVSRDQLYTFFEYPATDLLKAGCSIITSISDGSFVLVPQLQYNFNDNLDLTMILNMSTGREGRMFAKRFGSGGFIRARYYF